MNNLGMISAYSAYTGRSNSVYGSSQAEKTKQDSSADDNSVKGISSNDDINDEAIISDEAVNLFAADKNKKDSSNFPKDKSKKDDEPQTDGKAKNSEPKTKDKLSSEEQQEISQLKARDAEVRAHEQAHIAAAAGLRTSAPSFNYETGPDGKKYAIGGEVNISFTRSDDLQEDIQNAETMKAAALAPAQPSGQDMSVAKNADKIIEEDRQKLAQQGTEPEVNDKSEEPTNKIGNSEDEVADADVKADNKPDKEPLDKTKELSKSASI